MSDIKWGIIGCGDVTEVKSGPAFNKVKNSSLHAVMRRDLAKARDYAERHHVPEYYCQADELINNPAVDAIYIATPPLYHEEYTIAALQAGKPVYVEKPMTMNESSALKMLECSKTTGVKLCVAHYRRGLPIFKKIKELIDSGEIGEVRFVRMKLFQPDQAEMIAKTQENWRVNPEISGGGLFHDLAPHQLDLMLYFFGDVKTAHGIALNQASLYKADDLVSGEMVFKNNILFQGLWCFTVPEEETADICEINGTKGKITFSVFGHYYKLKTNGKEERFDFEKPMHIQQPMIQEVVDYFLGKGPNPCPAEEAAKVMRIMDDFTRKS
ncbi:Gfo/Idh/MocA family protein [Rubrolithibacter danxiaensis]|uniref:Gfo/Idh/MocA family protein n=1 Tax=Rubrolithibacter danxiaensis TaxID=3390805 RepID=UPI003BF837FD